MITVWALEGIPEVRPGEDIARLITDAAAGSLESGDILVVTSKIVSKAEGRILAASDRERAITDESVRVVASREYPSGLTRITQNRQGFIMAAAGVDASNTPDGTVLLLPIDPDASARALRASLHAHLGLVLGVVISDTFGRAWREGQTDVAIGAAGIRVITDFRGTTDSFGHELQVTELATADELAGAAELVKGKAAGRPVVVIRGLADAVTEQDGPGAVALVRPADRDMFHTGSDESYAAGYADGFAAADG